MYPHIGPLNALDGLIIPLIPQARLMDEEFRIGPWLVKPSLNAVSRDGTTVHLEPKVMEVLVCLAQHAGESVPKEELIQAVWPDIFVTEDVLRRCVAELRRVFEDDAHEPSIIETIPKRGYRLLVPAEKVGFAALPKMEQQHVLLPSPVPSKLESPVNTLPSGRTYPKWLRWAAVVLLSLSCFVAGSLLEKRRTSGIALPSFVRLTFRRGTVYSARFAPDGHVVYDASWNNESIRLFTSRSDSAESLPLDIKSANLLAISHDGEVAVSLNGIVGEFPVLVNGTLARTPLSGGAPREVLEDVRYADWDALGQLAVVHHLAGISRLEYPIGKVLYQTPGWISHLRLSPTGDRIAFLDHPAWPDDRGSVVVIDLRGAKGVLSKRVLSTGWESLQGLAWTPKEDEIWFTATKSGMNRDLFAVNLSGNLRTVFRVPARLTLHDIAPDGRVLLTFGSERIQMVALSVPENKETVLSWRDSTLPADISKDGKRVLFDEQGEGTGSNYYVAVRDTSGSPPVRLGEGVGGRFSPDGGWTAIEVPDVPESIMLLPIGTGQAREIRHKGIENSPWLVAFMPDAQHVIFAGIEPGHAVRTYIQDLDGGEPRAITPEGAKPMLPSPNGKYIAALDAEENLAIYPLAGGDPIIPPALPKRSFLARWSPDSKYLYAYRRSDVPCNVYRVDWRTGRREIVQQLMPRDPAGVFEISPVVMTPDAKLFVYSYDRILSELYVVSGLH